MSKINASQPVPEQPSPFKRPLEPSPTEIKISELMNKKGYLILEQGELKTTDNLAQAQASHREIKEYLSGLSEKINPNLLKTINLRLSDEQLKASIGPMTSTELTRLLLKHLNDHGLVSTLKLLDHICDEKIKKNVRFNPVGDWPKTKTTRLLHLHPNIGHPAPSPLKPGSPILSIMEPSLTISRSIADKKISNAELLMMGSRALHKLIKDLPEATQQQILSDYKILTSYYKHKPYFPCSLRNQHFLFTVPTARYTPHQFLAISTTDRKDILMAGQVAAKKKLEDAVEYSSLSKSKTLSELPSSQLEHQELVDVIKEVEDSIKPNAIIKNDSDVFSMATLLKELPPGSFIAQNSPDTSTDAAYQHFQIFLEAPLHLIPLFNSNTDPILNSQYKDREGNLQSIHCDRAVLSEFQSSIYRITLSSNDDISNKFLDTIQNEFLANDQNGSSLTLVSRKTDFSSEYYFILRKSILMHPKLQQEALEKGSTRPGWVEMSGMRLIKTEQELINLPDERYAKEILESFAVNPRECAAFEQIVTAHMPTPITYS